MSYLRGAVFAFLIPIVILLGLFVALGAPVGELMQALGGAVVAGVLAVAPFVVMAWIRRRSPPSTAAVVTGLVLVIVPWALLIGDAATAPPGRGVNIGLGLLLIPWPLAVLFVMAAVAFFTGRRGRVSR
jgi:hypothetical protein